MKPSLRATTTVLALLLLASCVPPQPFSSRVNGELFFSADNGARVDVMPADCLVSGDACPSAITLSLYPEEWNVASLTWTADGATAAVTSADQPNDHLALLTPPSRQLHRFASLATISQVVWSLDGKQLAVSGVAERGQKNTVTAEEQIRDSAIYLYSATGKELGNLTEALSGIKSGVAWLSPDQLLFQNFYSEQDCDLYVLTISNGALAPWTESPLCHASPAIAQDAAQVAFVRDGNLYLANADGSSAAMILDLPADIDEPAWSPDGQWIAFDEVEPAAVAVVHPDGTGYQPVADNMHNAGFAPLTGEALLVTTASHPQGSGSFTASWYVTTIPDGQPGAVTIPGIPPDQMPLNIAWRPPKQ